MIYIPYKLFSQNLVSDRPLFQRWLSCYTWQKKKLVFDWSKYSFLHNFVIIIIFYTWRGTIIDLTSEMFVVVSLLPDIFTIYIWKTKNVTFESKFYEILPPSILLKLNMRKLLIYTFFYTKKHTQKLVIFFIYFKQNIILMPKVYKKTRATDSVQTNIIIK